MHLCKRMHLPCRHNKNKEQPLLQGTLLLVFILHFFIIHLIFLKIYIFRKWLFMHFILCYSYYSVKRYCSNDCPSDHFLHLPHNHECSISLSALSIAHFSLFVKRVFFIFLLQFLIPSRFYNRAFSPIHIVYFSIIDFKFYTALFILSA